jgi:hypothetical protein
MFAHLHYALAAGWLLLAISGLLWTLGCAMMATKMEREGILFWKAFVTCLILTPLVGLITIGVARVARPNRPLVHSPTRS